MPAPHAAPALFTRTCKTFSLDANSFTRRSTSEYFDMSAGMLMHVPGPVAFSSLAVASQSLADRDEM